MNNIIAFDCSSNRLQIYLQHGKDEYFNIREIGLRHSERLLPLIDSILKEANLKPSELDLIACTKGPGSFTGLRIGMATAKGISAATNVPIVSVGTLDYLFDDIKEECFIIPVIDAKKKRYYSRIFFNGKPVSKAMDISLDNLIEIINKEADENQKIIITGPDAKKAKEELSSIAKSKNIQLNIILDAHFEKSRIKNLAQLAILEFQKNGADAEGAGPVYLRKSDAEESLLNNG